MSELGECRSEWMGSKAETLENMTIFGFAGMTG